MPAGGAPALSAFCIAAFELPPGCAPLPSLDASPVGDPPVSVPAAPETVWLLPEAARFWLALEVCDTVPLGATVVLVPVPALDGPAVGIPAFGRSGVEDGGDGVSGSEAVRSPELAAGAGELWEEPGADTAVAFAAVAALAPKSAETSFLAGTGSFRATSVAETMAPPGCAGPGAPGTDWMERLSALAADGDCSGAPPSLIDAA